MIKIINEDFIKYNANVRGADVGDCFARSLSLAYNIPYKDVRKELLDCRRYDYEDINSDSNTQRYIRNKGYIKKLHFQEATLPVADFVQQNPTGCWIIYCSRGHNRNGHLSCIINGDVYDTWDCSDPTLKYCVTDAFLISAENATSGLIKNFVGIPDDFVGEVQEYIERKFNYYDELCGFSANKIKLSHQLTVRKAGDDTLDVFIRLGVNAREYFDFWIDTQKSQQYFKLELSQTFEDFKKNVFQGIDEAVKKLANSFRLKLNKLFLKYGFNIKLDWEKQQRAPRVTYEKPKGATVLGVPVDGRVIDEDLYKQLPAKYRPGCIVLKRYKDGIAYCVWGEDDQVHGINDIQSAFERIQDRVGNKTITNATVQKSKQNGRSLWYVDAISKLSDDDFNEDFIKKYTCDEWSDIFDYRSRGSYDNGGVIFLESGLFPEYQDLLDLIQSKVPDATIETLTRYNEYLKQDLEFTKVTFHKDQILDIIK